MSANRLPTSQCFKAERALGDDEAQLAAGRTFDPGAGLHVVVEVGEAEGAESGGELLSDIMRCLGAGGAVAEHDVQCGRRARGAIVALVLSGGDERAFAVIRRLRVSVEATSLGGVESLASLPFNSSHFDMTAAERLEAGIPPGLLRLSVGVEGAEALIEDLRQALAATR